MFVLSVHSKKLRAVIVIVAAVICLGGLLFIILRDKGNSENERSFAGAEPSERLAFIDSYGWTVDEEPIEVTEILIPEEFDDVYVQYNTIQLKEGFDLTDYCGMRVKRWTYSVTNYPGYTSGKLVRINLLISDGIVIGGDVCSVELDGFMHGFTNPFEPVTECTTAESATAQETTAEDIPEDTTGIVQSTTQLQATTAVH